jgi:hypothetical protein
MKIKPFAIAIHALVWISLLIIPYATTDQVSTIPTAVRGNIINKTDAENYALGYFRLSEVAASRYTIK